MKSCKLIIQDHVNVKFSDLDAPCRRDIVDALKFMVPYARHTPQFKMGRWDGMVSYATVGGSSYFNLLDRILPILIRNDYDLGLMEVVDMRQPTNFSFTPVTDEYLADTVWPDGHRFEGEPIMLLDHQVEAINLYLENPQSLQSISTSAGKTIITGCLSKIVEPYGRSLVIVPGKDLVLQTCKDYLNIGLDTGRYFGEHKEPDHQHVIATWQSITTLMKKNPEILSRILKDCVAVIVDEAHTINGKELRDFLTGPVAHVPLRWAMTGTVPKDDYAFFALLCSIGPQVGEVRADELMEKGILSRCNIHVQQLVDNCEFKNWDDEKTFLSSDKARLEYIAQRCKEIALTGNTLVLLNSIEMGKALSSALDAPFVYGLTKTKDRSEEYGAINYSDNRLLFATFGVASTGINIPRIFNLVLIDAGKSFQRVIQSIGRGLRKAVDKDSVEIYDFCSSLKFSKRHLTKRKEFYSDANYKFKVTKIKYKEF